MTAPTPVLPKPLEAPLDRTAPVVREREALDDGELPEPIGPDPYAGVEWWRSKGPTNDEA